MRHNRPTCLKVLIINATSTDQLDIVLVKLTTIQYINSLFITITKMSFCNNINLCDHKVFVQLEGNANQTCHLWSKLVCSIIILETSDSASAAQQIMA